MAEMLGLDAFDTAAGAEEGAAMEVISPAGEVLRWPDGRPWTITYYGGDSKRIEKLALIQQDRRSAAFFRTNVPQQTAIGEKNRLDLLVEATKSWDIPLANGEPAKNDREEYRAAYTKYRWLADQGHVFVGTRANFLNGGPKNS